MTFSPQTTGNKNEISDGKRKKSQNSDEIVHDMAIQKIKDNIKNIQENTTRRMNEELHTLVTEMVENIEKAAFRDDFSGLFDPISEKDEVPRMRNNVLVLPERQFLPRNSLLTDLFEVKHIRSIYHMFIAVLIISFMNSGLSDALNDNEIRLGLRYLPIGFGKFQQAVVIWMFMFIATLLVYPLFRLWAEGRPTLGQNKYYGPWDVTWLLGCIAYVVAFVYFSLKWRDYDMPVASSAIVLLEQTRMIMKIHAFIRSNVPAVISKTKPLPGFSRFLYFLFAPTLVYRNVYPRTNVIRWSFVVARLVEMVGAMFMISFIVEHYLVPEFSDFGLKSQTWGDVIGSVFRTILPASMIMLCGFFLLLHSWLNAWAEALRFADRLFYRDWWNTHSFSAFYRTWNVVVHDYLFTYIYRDVHQLLGGNSLSIAYRYRRLIATFAVFTVSAVAHEFIIGFMLGFCYPVLFVQFFGIGMAFALVNSSNQSRTGHGNGIIARCGNVFIWWSLACGIGMQISFYTMEMVARWNCPEDVSQFRGGWQQYFVPRSWTCNGLGLTLN